MLSRRQRKLHSVMKLADAIKDEKGRLQVAHVSEHEARTAAHTAKVVELQEQLTAELAIEHETRARETAKLSAGASEAQLLRQDKK